MVRQHRERRQNAGEQPDFHLHEDDLEGRLGDDFGVGWQQIGLQGGPDEQPHHEDAGQQPDDERDEDVLQAVLSRRKQDANGFSAGVDCAGGARADEIEPEPLIATR